MRSPAWQAADPPDPAPAPADRRFGAATPGRPGAPAPPPAAAEAPLVVTPHAGEAALGAGLAKATGGDAPARRPGPHGMLVPALTLLVLGALLFGRWSANRGDVLVWQATRPIPAGKALTAADLRQGAVATALARGTVAAATTPDGWVARVPIPAGALLTPDVLTHGPALPRHGEALVGVALGPGAAPADGLAAGDLVRVVRIPVAGEEAAVGPAGRVVRAAAPVWATKAGKDGATTVTLRVPTADADLIAGLSARGAIALERVAGPG